MADVRAGIRYVEVACAIQREMACRIESGRTPGPIRAVTAAVSAGIGQASESCHDNAATNLANRAAVRATIRHVKIPRTIHRHSEGTVKSRRVPGPILAAGRTGHPRYRSHYSPAAYFADRVIQRVRYVKGPRAVRRHTNGKIKSSGAPDSIRAAAGTGQARQGMEVVGLIIRLPP